MENSKGTILIVDDNINNLKVLAGVLKENLYDFRMAKSGQLALNILEKTTPDLILLDIQMPEMDGFETCRRIKENEANEKIPIIFLTANIDSESIAKAFEAGGLDYVTKPFNSNELLARIKTHIKLKTQTEELERQNATKDKFFSIISHDLKNPIANIIGFSDVIIEDYNVLKSADIQTFVGYINLSAKFTLELLQNLLEWSRIQIGSIESVKENFDLSNLLEINIEGSRPQALAKNIEIKIDFEKNLVTHADEKMISTVIRNLISNAIKFTPLGGTITILSKRKLVDDKKVIETRISDTGIGMTEEDIQKLFKIEQNYISKGTNNETGTGLGLILCKEFLTQNDGTIRVESQLNIGSDFIFTLDLVN